MMYVFFFNNSQKKSNKKPIKIKKEKAEKSKVK